MCAGVVCACMYVYHMHVLLMEAKIGFIFPITGAIDCCELACRSWEQNHLGPLKEHPLFLRTESPGGGGGGGPGAGGGVGGGGWVGCGFCFVLCFE